MTEIEIKPINVLIKARMF